MSIDTATLALITAVGWPMVQQVVGWASKSKARIKQDTLNEIDARTKHAVAVAERQDAEIARLMTQCDKCEATLDMIKDYNRELEDILDRHRIQRPDPPWVMRRPRPSRPQPRVDDD